MPKNKAKSAANKVKKALAPGTLSIPKGTASSGSSAASSPTSTRGGKTPRTPADEGIAFFESEFKKGEPPVRVYELALDADGGPSKELSYIRLPPAYSPYVLRVSLEAGTPASRNGVFKTNFPLEGGRFDRNIFCERKLPTDFSKPIEIDLPISHAGAFAYWVEYDGATAGSRIKGRMGYFNIDPILRTKTRAPILSSELKPLSPSKGGGALKNEYTEIPLSAVSLLTTVSKWMGPVSKWPKFFQEARDRGYNMLHWTPLQERGESDSPYSIKDQLNYEPKMFDNAKDVGSDGGVTKMEAILTLAREEYGLLNLTDVVLNHTANNSTWLEEHPEAGFSPATFPHLTSALELDNAIIEFSGTLKDKGLPTTVNTMEDVDTLVKAFADFITHLNFWQYYVLDVKREKEEIQKALEGGKVIPWAGPDVTGKTPVEVAVTLRSFEDGKHIQGLSKYAKRFGVSVDGAVAAGIAQSVIPGADTGALVDFWGKVADVLNVPLYEEWEADTKIALESIRGRLKYNRLDAHGPRLGEITEKSPLMESYFARIPGHEKDPLKYSLAVNGWMWAADPLSNFALLPSKAYFQRTVIAWGDCVKLNYGSKPEDSPFLWEHMTKYVTTLAKAFTGFRLDNCHSTPLHVGTFLLDRAREVNPDLYVVAELFTGSEDMDTVFVSRLGINSLIREAGNAGDPKEFSRIIWRDGLGKPIGSMDGACMTTPAFVQSPTTSGKGPIRPCLVSPVHGSLPHALLYDQTHDNESTAMKLSAEHTLSAAAVVAFSWCAVGSVKGYDEVYPKLLELVTEKRQYEILGLGDAKEGEFGRSGIAVVKRLLNNLHREMVVGGYEEGHVHQENDYLVMHRVHPGTQKGYLMVAHCAFSNSRGSKDRGFIEPIRLRGQKVKYIFGTGIEFSDSAAKADDDTLGGIPSKLVPVPAPHVPEGSDGGGDYSEIVVPDYFPPGSIMIFETVLQGFDDSLDTFCGSGADEAFKELDLVDLNVVLFRAEGEELDATSGEIGAYDIPGAGKSKFCGLEGWMHHLRHIMRYNDLGHPVCGHLREGTWALDYISSRLAKQASYLPHLAKPAEWFKERFDRIKTSVPPYLRPKYFTIVISEAYKAARRAAIEQCSDFVSSGHSFTHDLALVAVQMHGLVQSASLDPGKPTPSLAAGLPHFAAGWARCWGRDVFISLRGLFLTTGNFVDAKRHILAFASTLKHGLIPNLLDSVRNPRYNSRDSPWWMLQNIQDYTSKAPDGLALLNEPVKRRFPKDDTWVPWDDPRAYSETSTVAEIIQEVLQRHASGISFREYNAGPNLDMQMRDPGFNIEVKVDWKTGLVHGGNEWNCGTWMDKMGESEKAGTKGLPGTPRDGAPVEITGLVKSTLRWLEGLASKGKFPFKGVEAEIDGKKRLVTYKEWNDLIQNSFETCYYVPLDPADDSKYNLSTSIVNRRGIYKDTFGAGPGREWSDYQFRPNFPIAMTVAPELFNPEHAMGALKLADEVLRGPLGMKTLDPNDMQYRPHYDNANDSSDAAVAKGRNYHQGPEWGWPLGYFLRAYLYFDTRVGDGKKDASASLHYMHNALLTSRAHIRKDPWRGLPELTNENGAFCYDSCPTQAWSASTLLDALEDAHAISAGKA